jgi:RNA ligase (TIGR02306 family)
MSNFEVKIRKIERLDFHPNAERLEVVVIGGWQCVVQKSVHKVGDLILYVPEDTIFTDISIAEKLKVASYLTGKYKNRVKAVRLRGLLSQGIVLPFICIRWGNFE